MQLLTVTRRARHCRASRQCKRGKNGRRQAVKTLRADTVTHIVEVVDGHLLALVGLALYLSHKAEAHGAGGDAGDKH